MRASLTDRVGLRAMAYETLRYEVADRIATIALDQPETRNALSDDVLRELTEAFAAARADDEVGCVGLTSTHDPVFSRSAPRSRPRRRRGRPRMPRSAQIGRAH